MSSLFSSSSSTSERKLRRPPVVRASGERSEARCEGETSSSSSSSSSNANSKKTLLVGGAAAALVAIIVLGGPSACTRGMGGTGSSARTQVIDGAGATLPFPLYAKWSTEVARVDPTVRVNYQPLGSGAGIRQMSDGVIDFGATDEPMSDEQMKRAAATSPQGDLVHVPMTIGAVVVAFNMNLEGTPRSGSLSGAASSSELRLTPELVADVFRGVVTRWDDPRLREANPNTPLPSQPITVVHRADGSGTSATFTTYLARSSPAWNLDVGASTTPRFPVGVGVRGNDGVAAYVKSTPYAIGYVELAYARQAGLPIALVRNRAGAYVAPTIPALDRAARSFLTAPIREDLRVSIVDSPAADAYPIAALSFIILPKDAKKKERARVEALARFLWWSLHDGQRFAEDLNYAPLPAELVTQAERVVRDLRAEGKPLDVVFPVSDPTVTPTPLSPPPAPPHPQHGRGS